MNVQEYDRYRSTVATELGEIGFADIGSGPPALFVHGVFLNGLLWRNVIESLRDDRRCIAVDLGAHGATRLKPGSDLSIPGHVRMLDVLCEALDLSAVDLVGNDSGGAIAQAFAVAHPERLRTLTLTNCDTHDNLPPPAFAAAVELAESGALAPLVVDMVSNLDMARSDAGLGVGYEHPEQLSDETVRAYLEPVAGTIEAARELERFITSLKVDDLLAIEPGLKELHVPTLVVWGTGDVFFETSWAYWLRDLIPGVTEVVEVEGAKLFFPDERADELVRPLRRHWQAYAPAG